MKVLTDFEKKLLFKDVFARIPYGLKLRFELGNGIFITKCFKGELGGITCFDPVYAYWMEKGFLYPFLRPMSSMTEEEKLYKENYFKYDFLSWDYVDWLNANHFDYRGLIGKGLAMRVDSDYNPYEYDDNKTYKYIDSKRCPITSEIY